MHIDSVICQFMHHVQQLYTDLDPSWVTHFSSFVAMASGSVSPSSSTMIGAFMLYQGRQIDRQTHKINLFVHPHSNHDLQYSVGIYMLEIQSHWLSIGLCWWSPALSQHRVHTHRRTSHGMYFSTKWSRIFSHNIEKTSSNLIQYFF